MKRSHLGHMDPSFPIYELFYWLLASSPHRSHLPVQSPPGTMLRLTRRQSETEQSASNHPKGQGDLGLTSTVDLRPHLDSVDISVTNGFTVGRHCLGSTARGVQCRRTSAACVGGIALDESGNLWALSESATVMTARTGQVSYIPRSHTPPSSLLLLRYLYRLCGFWCFQISDKS